MTAAWCWGVVLSGMHAHAFSSTPYSVCIFLPASACQGRTLTTAWVGDSRMVLGRQRKKGWRSSWEAIDLSDDHKPTTPEERQRILDSHGRVERWAHSACARHGAASSLAVLLYVAMLVDECGMMFVTGHESSGAAVVDLSTCSSQAW